MEGASFQFIAFGLLVAVLSRYSDSAQWRLVVLLAGNAALLVLLGARVPALLPLGGFLAAGYGFVLLLRRGVTPAQAVGVIALILGFAWLKRYTIFPPGLFLTMPYVTVGLSYIFFRVLHLVIEARHEGAARHVPLRHYLAYTLNFTTFVSGPIQRYEDYLAQAEAPPAPLDWGVIGQALERIAIGFFKVNVVALLLNMIHADALADLARPIGGGERAWALFRIVAAYPFFLYCNFSGYIDIVIAIARLMGMVLPENFDRPFSSRSAIEFWTRWHITLSTWLKTYVYNPLLTTFLRHNRWPALEPAFGVLCFFVTFFLVGIWHGRTSEFVMFGVLQGGGVALNKIWQIRMGRRLGKKAYKALAARPVYAHLARGLTFTWFALTMIWFWADWQQIGRVLTAVPLLLEIAIFGLLWVAATVMLGGWETLLDRIATRPTLIGAVCAPISRTMWISLLVLVSFLFVAVLSQPAPGIVYRTF